MLDPVRTVLLPERQVANGVVDAFVHTMEQYLTYPVDARCRTAGPKASAYPGGNRP